MLGIHQSAVKLEDNNLKQTDKIQNETGSIKPKYIRVELKPSGVGVSILVKPLALDDNQNNFGIQSCHCSMDKGTKFQTMSYTLV